MKIALTPETHDTLKAFLSQCEDCEQLTETEYVLDLYDHTPPMSLDLVLKKNALFIDGAAELLFDEEMDGWYVGKRIEDIETIAAALKEAGAMPA